MSRAARHYHSTWFVVIVAVFVTCLLIATPIVFMLVRGQRQGFMRRLRRLPLAAYFAFKVVFYFVVIVGGLLVARLLLSNDVVHYVEEDPVFRQALVFSVVSPDPTETML